jgi:hypothetical protein
MNFGQDNASARDSYVYHYFVRCGGEDVGSTTCDEDGSPCGLVIQGGPTGYIDLARVSASDMGSNFATLNTKFEWFTGLDGNLDPTWGTAGNLSVSYNIGLGRYILITEHTTSQVGNMGMFDAPEPWGPWTTIVYYTEPNDFQSKIGVGGDVGSKAFFWNFSQKWTSGADFALIWTGGGSGSIDDSFNVIEGTFTTGDGTGTAYYVDCSDSGSTNQGTFAEPFNSIANVNSFSFATSDDVYFKDGVECETSGSGGLVIDWDGTPDEDIIIGCYDGDGDFDCETVRGVSGYGHIDGDTNDDGITDMNDYTRLIRNHVSGEAYSYITIQNMKLSHGFTGIGIQGEADASGRQHVGNGPDTNITVKESWFYRNEASAWLVAGNVDNVTFTNNLEEENVYINIRRGYAQSGDAGNSSCTIVQPMGQWNDNGYWEGNPKNLIWEKSTIKDCGREWINVYHPDGMYIRQNKFYGTWMINYGINLAGHFEGLDPLYIQDNLFEGHKTCTSGSNCGGFDPIVLGDWDTSMDECLTTEEEWIESEYGGGFSSYAEFEDIYITGNMFAGWSGPYHATDGKGGNASAISLINGQWEHGCQTRKFKNIYIENNTSIDNDTFLSFSNHYYAVILDNSVYVRNNIIWLTAEADAYSSHYECFNYLNQGSCDEMAQTATYDGNLYNTDPTYKIGALSTPVGATWAEGANDPGYPDYASQTLDLSKMSGYRNLTEGELDGSEFALLSTSDAIDDGINLGAALDDRLTPVTGLDLTASPIAVVKHDQDNYGAAWEIGALLYHDNTKPTITDPTASETGIALDGTAGCVGADDCFDITYSGSGTQYATDWKIVIFDSDCDAGASQGGTSSCNTATPGKLAWNWSGLIADESYKLCTWTYDDLDAGGDCDSWERSAEGFQVFSTQSTGFPAGTHEGSNDAQDLYDADAGFTPDALVGWTINNTTDTSSCVILSNTATGIVCEPFPGGELTGGIDNDWDTLDAYTLTASSGTHDGHTSGSNSTDLEDADAGWTVDGLIGFEVVNTTDSNSWSVVTDNDADTVIGTLQAADGTCDTEDCDWDIPDAYTLTDYPGTHDGADDAATLRDLNAGWVVDALIGDVISNDTDGSSCTITDNDASTITCALADGTDDDWGYKDAYTIIPAAPPVGYGTTMLESLTDCGVSPCGETMLETAVDCGGSPCGQQMVP